MQPRAVQVLEAVPAIVRRWPEYTAWVDKLKQSVHDHVRSIQLMMEAGDSDIQATYELSTGGEEPAGTFNITSKEGTLSKSTKAKAELMARVKQYAADDAEPAPAATSVTVEADDEEGIKRFRQWLTENAAQLSVKTDEVDDVSTFFLFNQAGEYVGYYSYEAGGAYGLGARDHSEFEALIEPKAETDLEPAEVQRLIDYIDSYYPA